VTTHLVPLARRISSADFVAMASYPSRRFVRILCVNYLVFNPEACLTYYKTGVPLVFLHYANKNTEIIKTTLINSDDGMV
jgi:hypothetical protein